MLNAFISAFIFMHLHISVKTFECADLQKRTMAASCLSVCVFVYLFVS